MREKLKDKNDNYIYREHEYRKTIALLKQKIDENSKKTLKQPQNTADNELDLEGGISLNLNAPKDNAQLDSMDDGVFRVPEKSRKIVEDNNEILNQISQM